MSIGKQVRRENHERTDKKKREREVLVVLDKHGCLCGEQVMKIMGVTNPNRVRPRLSEMAVNGKVREVGKALNSEGRPETVYEIADEGKAILVGMEVSE